MNSLQRQILNMNTKNLIKPQKEIDCKQWLRDYFSITKSLDETSIDLDDAYRLAYEFVVGQLALLHSPSIINFLGARLDKARDCHDKNDYKRTFLWLYTTSNLAKLLVRKPDVKAETWLTTKILQHQVLGHLYQLQTLDEWNVNEMYIANDALKNLYHLSSKNMGLADWLVAFLNYSYKKGSIASKSQKELSIVNYLFGKFLVDEDLCPERDFDEFSGRFAIITSPINRPKVKEFIEGHIDDKSFADFIAHTVLKVLNNLSVPKEDRSIRGLLLAVNVFGSNCAKYCYKKTANEGENSTNRIIGYFHTVMLMIDLLAHHFIIPKKCESRALVSPAYYNLMNYLRSHSFGGL